MHGHPADGRFRLSDQAETLVPNTPTPFDKADVSDEERPRHWHDAIGLLIREDLDWEYLVRRARHATRRVLALLLYATSNDIAIPERVIRELFAVAYPQEAT